MDELLNKKLVFRQGALSTIDRLRQNVLTKSPTKYGPMNASGRAADSFRYRWIDDTRLQIYSDMPGRDFNYIMTLETGRKPGKWPPRSSIMDWIKERNIQPEGNISRESLAFLIQRSIGTKGTKVYQQGGNTGIISEVQSAEWVEEHFIKPIRKTLKRNLEIQLSEI